MKRSAAVAVLLVVVSLAVGCSRSGDSSPIEAFIECSALGGLAGQIEALAGNTPAEASGRGGRDTPLHWDRGMNFVGFDRNAFSAGAGNRAIDAAAHQLGTKTAVFVPHWYVRHGGSSKVFRHWKTPSDSGLRAIARHARNQLGMNVVIKPHVDGLDGTWRGYMQFRNRKVFWNSYSRVITNYAKIANAVHATGLVVGTELSAIQNDQPRQWKKLIRKVRKRFNGRVYYAANWDTLTSVKSLPEWFSKLDVIGADFYVDNANCSAARMWKYLVQVRRRFGTGIVVSESGGDSRHDQKREYTATYREMLAGRDRSWFKGIWWYNRFTFAKGGYGKTWNEFTPDKPTSKWLCKKQTRRSERECERLIERVW